MNGQDRHWFGWVGWGLAAVLASVPCRAGELVVTARDHADRPLAEAVVFALPPTGMSLPAPQRRSIMDQVDREFMPHVLAVQAHTTVDFPNSDAINHHVYSFSPARKFQLKLFKNDRRPHAVEFDRPGVVTLGCNIHDWMLGYIYVVDTPWFAVTDDQGRAKIDLPDTGTYALRMWHPRAADTPASTSVSIPGSAERQAAELRLQQPLKPQRRVRGPQREYEG